MVITQILQCIDAFGFFGEVLMFFLICASLFCFQISFLPSYIFFYVSFFPLSLLFFLFFAPLLFFSLGHTFLHTASLYQSKIIFFLLSTSVVHFYLLLTLISFANPTLMFPKLVSCHLCCLSPLCTLQPIVCFNDFL